MCDVGVGYNKSNFYENLMGSRPLNMPENLIKKIIDQAARYFPKVKIGYAFTEPLIYPHLISSLRYAQTRNLYTSVTTNALTLRKMASDLVDAGLNDLFVSLDGPPEVHNFIRGHKHSFERAVQGIEALLELKGRPEISVFCVITQWNFDHLCEMVQHLEHFPLRQIGFMHTNFTTEEMANHHNLQYADSYPATPSNMTEIDLEQMNLKLLHAECQLLRSRPGEIPITFSPDLKTYSELETFYHRPNQILGKRCNDVFSNMMIKSNGDVIPAHGRCYNLTIGNLDQENLKQIWNGEIVSTFRKKLLRGGGLLPACARCCSAF